MALATTTLATPLRIERTDARWPRQASIRWAIRLALAVPFLVLSDLSNAVRGASLVDSRLHHHAASLPLAGGQLGWVTHAYPPVTVAIARVIPGGPALLGNLGALCAGVLLQIVIERLVLRSVSVKMALVLAASLVATPAFLFEATQDFPAFLSLTLLAVGAAGLLDFVLSRLTERGFISGLSFGVATMCDPAAPVFGLAGAIAALLVSPVRQRGARDGRDAARRRAAMAVLVFPTIATMAGWMFLQWRFTGSWTASFTRQEPGLFAFPEGVLGTLHRALLTTGHDLVLAPMLFVSFALLVRRRPRSALACLFPCICVVVDLWIGAPLAASTIIVLLQAFALLVLPENLSRLELSALWLALGAQLALVWATHAHDQMAWSWLQGLH